MSIEKDDQAPVETHEHAGESREIQEKQEHELKEKIHKFEEDALRKDGKAEMLEEQKASLPRRDDPNRWRLNGEIAEARTEAELDRKQVEKLREKLDSLDKKHAGRQVGH